MELTLVELLEVDDELELIEVLIDVLGSLLEDELELDELWLGELQPLRMLIDNKVVNSNIELVFFINRTRPFLDEYASFFL